jgi:hypothetical protein
MRSFFILVCGALCWSVTAEVLPPRPATQSEVNAGTDAIHPVTSKTLNGWSGGGGGPTNGLTQAQVQAVVANTNNNVVLPLVQASTNNLPLASEANAGQLSSNLYIQTEWFPNQQESLTRLPPMGIASFYGAFDGTSWTNHAGVSGISNALASGNVFLRPWGYNYVFLDDGWGQTNLDPNGLMQLSYGISNTFGAGTWGVSNFIAAIHTNGWKLGLYADGGTNLSTGGFQHGIGGFLLWTNIASLGRYGLDYLKTDQQMVEKQRIAALIAANGFPMILSGAVTNGGDIAQPTVYAAFMNELRPVSGGDINSWGQLLRWVDVTQTNNWYRWVRPGHFINMDYIGEAILGGGGWYGIKTHLVVCALYSAPIIWDSGFIAGVSVPTATNVDLIAIDQDPGVFCAQRLLQTNGCDVFLKPLGAQNGPQFALGILNRSVTPTNVTLYLTNLYPLFVSGATNWTAKDCVTNGWAFQNTNAFSVTLGTNDSVLWRLYPYFPLNGGSSPQDGGSLTNLHVPDPLSLSQANIGTQWTTNLLTPTNAFAGTAADFSKSEWTTNLGGNLTFTGVTNVTAGAYNATIEHLYPGGADRTISFPANFHVTRGATSVVSNAFNHSDFLFTIQPGLSTNVAQLDFP